MLLSEEARVEEETRLDEETIEEDEELDSGNNVDVNSDEDEERKVEPLEEILEIGLDVQPVKIAAIQVKRMIGWIGRLNEKAVCMVK
jgi:hypothetical protein